MIPQCVILMQHLLACDTCATHAWHECNSLGPYRATKGVRGWFLIHEMHLKIFSIKFPDPQGAPTFCVSLTTDLICAQGKTPTE